MKHFDLNAGLLGWKSLLPRLKDQVFTAWHADITDHWDVLSHVFSGFSHSFWGFLKYLYIYIKRSFCKICAKYFRVSYHIICKSWTRSMANTGAEVLGTSTVQHPGTQITWIWEIHHRFALFHMHTYFCQELMIHSSGLLLPHTLCPPCLKCFYHLQLKFELIPGQTRSALTRHRALLGQFCEVLRHTSSISSFII